MYFPLAIGFNFAPFKARISFNLVFTIAEVFLGYLEITSNFAIRYTFNTFKMLQRIRIVKELRILVAVVLQRIIFFITNTVWEIVCNAIAVAHMALITKFFNFIELWIFVKEHNRCTE